MSSGQPEFLLLKRAEDQLYPGIWQCITGKIQFDEKSFQTALRELKEETGLLTDKLWVIDQVNHYYEPSEDRMNLIPVFGAVVSSKNVILSKEHSQFKWCPIIEIEKLLLWNQQKTGARRFYEMLVNEKDILPFTKVDILTGMQTLRKV